MYGSDRLRVGVITSPHGIAGEVNVYPTTDDPARFKYLKKVYIDNIKELIPSNIESVKFFKGMVILKLDTVKDRNAAELLRKRDLLIDREDAVPLEEGEFFICDLVGLEVVTDGGERLGVLEDILQTGANDVYSVKMEDGKELLIPVTDECVKSIEPENGKIIVHLLPGLLDL
ncbi:MAG: 16S rRNA processing protein RimM [Lachnospiraceae bacterium]|nr:16S rRNA processing protein RimM [Lachnospiraceae bacterium]